MGAVDGGQAAETAATARTRAGVFDSISNVDVEPGFTDEDDVVFIGQETAARVAGLIAGKGFTKSITFAKVTGGAKVEAALTTAEIGLSLEAGVCVITADGDTVRVEKGINTFTSYDSDRDKDKSVTKIRTIATPPAVTVILPTPPCPAGTLGALARASASGAKAMIGACARVV